MIPASKAPRRPAPPLPAARRLLRALGFAVDAEPSRRIVFVREDGWLLRAARRPELVAAGRALLVGFLEAFGEGWSVQFAGLPPCVLSGAETRLRWGPVHGLRAARLGICRLCRRAPACPGFPDPDGSGAVPAAFAGALEPIRAPLREVALEVTGACNLRCGLCLLRDGGRSEPPARALRRVLEDARTLGVGVVRFTGGEPLLRPDLFELMACAKEAGLAVLLNTNGTLLDERLVARLEGLVDSVLFSLQGHDAASERRLTGGDFFARKCAMLSALAASRVPSTRMDTVATRTLASEGAAYARLLRRLGVRHWVVNRPMPGPANRHPEYAVDRRRMLSVLALLRRLRRDGLQTHVGNAVPFCMSGDPLDLFLFEANTLTEGHDRLVYDCRGFFKPSYHSEERLGSSLAAALRAPRLRALRSLRAVPAACARCLLLKDCVGGSRSLARAAGGGPAAPDPWMSRLKNPVPALAGFCRKA
ncbi:MAG: radical SAM protein [Elusimicrobiota bacterium]|jgi:MoaA/NifB/PqqE/SkfB family radical SAM enzyme